MNDESEMTSAMENGKCQRFFECCRLTLSSSASPSSLFNDAPAGGLDKLDQRVHFR